jgi:hypothetical protein
MDFRLRAVSIRAVHPAELHQCRCRDPVFAHARLIVMHHLVDDVPADALRNGLSLLGAAVIGPYTLPATQPQEARP